MILNAFVRYKGNNPATINNAVAVDGFNQLGIKIIPFEDINRISPSSDTIVHGYISDVFTSLKKLNKKLPEPIDYPIELEKFYGRKITRTTLGEIKYTSNKLRTYDKPIFIKPISHKLFNGLIYFGLPSERLYLSIYDDETPCYCCHIIDFISEYRCFILNNKILDVRKYKGDWSVSPSKDIVEEAVGTFNGPAAYTMDFGITKDNKTLIVECNDGFAFGSYGLSGINYAKMLEARWEELVAYNDI